MIRKILIAIGSTVLAAGSVWLASYTTALIRGIEWEAFYVDEGKCLNIVITAAVIVFYYNFFCDLFIKD